MSRLGAVQCRHPEPCEWFRVRPGAERRASTFVLSVAQQLYLVSEELWPRLRPALEHVCPRACMNERGELFVWPVPVPLGATGPKTWRASAAGVADLAEAGWCRMLVNESTGDITVSMRRLQADAPPWPDASFIEILHEAFRGRVIGSMSHPVVRKRRKR